MKKTMIALIGGIMLMCSVPVMAAPSPKATVIESTSVTEVKSPATGESNSKLYACGAISALALATAVAGYKVSRGDK